MTSPTRGRPDYFAAGLMFKDRGLQMTIAGKYDCMVFSCCEYAIYNPIEWNIAGPTRSRRTSLICLYFRLAEYYVTSWT